MNEFQKQKQIVMWCISNGIDLQYQKLSLCDLRNYRYSMVKNDRRYQVYCEDKSYGWSGIYDDLSAATNKFLELKSRLRRPKHLVK